MRTHYTRDESINDLCQTVYSRPELAITIHQRAITNHWVIEFSSDLLPLYELIDPKAYGRMRSNDPRPLCVSPIRNSACDICGFLFAVEGRQHRSRLLVDVPFGGDVFRLTGTATRVKSLTASERKIAAFTKLIALDLLGEIVLRVGG